MISTTMKELEIDILVITEVSLLIDAHPAKLLSNTLLNEGYSFKALVRAIL